MPNQADTITDRDESARSSLSDYDAQTFPLGRRLALRLNRRWAVAGILALTALLYARALGNAFVFDDVWMIRLNPYITQWSFLWRSLTRDSWWFQDPNHLPQSPYYRPLQDIWFGLNYQIFGFNPTGWHAATIAIHVVTVWLVYQTARLIVADETTALIAMLLFAVLPVHAEAVVWVAAIPQPLSATFTLAAFYFFMRRKAKPRRNWLLALLFAGCALVSHESAIVFPGLVAIYVFLLEAPAETTLRRAEAAASIQTTPPRDPMGPEWASGRLRQATIAAAPFIAEIIAYLALRMIVLGALTYRHTQAIYVTKRVVLLTVPWDLLNFTELLLMPWRAGVAHRVNYVMSWTAPQFWAVLIAFALVAGLMTFAPYRKQPLHLFCALWFLLTLMPEVNLLFGFPFTFVQDRYLYLPSFAWCVFLGDTIVGIATTCERQLS